jgi:hypothetical protein
MIKDSTVFDKIIYIKHTEIQKVAKVLRKVELNLNYLLLMEFIKLRNF